MNLLDKILDQRRLVLTTTLLLSLSGALAWMLMVRQEDPRLPDFWGQVVTPYPGADAESVELQVLEPIEKALGEVNQIKEINATAYDEFAFVAVELRGDVQDFTEAWDEVRDAVEKAKREFPAGAGSPQLDEKQQNQDSVVLAVTGSADPVELLRGARRLRDSLLEVPLVSQVRYVANPGEQAVVELDDAAARRLGISPEMLAIQLDARNRVLPGGSLELGGRSVRLRPLSQFSGIDEIAATPVVLPSGSSVPLDQIAHVRLGPKEPVSSLMRFNGEMSVGLGIVPQKSINLVTFGERVRAKVADVAPSLSPLQVREVIFQPDRVGERLSQLSGSLLQGTLIVSALLFLFMGVRLGLIVGSVVPLVAATSLAIYSWGGGVLHQISIAALVLALGMLVDNAIVVAENVQWRLDRGESKRSASVGAVRELAVPLAGATGTTLAAFVPMLMAEGSTAVFTRAIPVVLMLTLTVSYVFAIFVTPVLSEIFLSARASATEDWLERAGGRLAGLALRRPGRVLAIALALVFVSLTGASWVKRQFFPSSDRNQLLVDIKMPEGMHLDSTGAASLKLEKALLPRQDVAWVASFIGRSAPHFYYNISFVPFDPQYAQVVIETRRPEEVEPLLTWIRGFSRDRLPEAEVVVRKLEQGPPVQAPVEVRLQGEDLAALSAAADVVRREVRDVSGTADVRHDVGPGSPSVRFHIDDASAARFGLSRADVARTLYGRTRGLPIGELRMGEDPIPVVVRSSAGERMTPEDLESVGVVAPDGRLIPLAQVARLEASWRPAAIKHRDGSRVVTVSAQLQDGFTFSDVLAKLRPRMAQKSVAGLPAGVSYSFGGDAEGSGKANTAMMRTLPVGLLLLFGVLLVEFNSFRRVGIILVTVPLAATGVIPGLLLSGQPFGFMSLLGVFALIGIVVNNAIVLLEVVDARRAEGATLDEALTDAVVRRIRPIFLTTGTTVVGLIPLAFSQSTLWPPLAWAIMSGLTASTMLTLLVVPALYRVIFGRSAQIQALKHAAAATATMLLLALTASTTWSEPLHLDLLDAMRRGADRPAAAAAGARAEAAEHAAGAERRAAFLPGLGVSVQSTTRDRTLSLVTPIGSFAFGDKTNNTAGVEVVQPIFDAGRMIFGSSAAQSEAAAAQQSAQRARRQLAAAAGFAYLELIAIDARAEATRSFVESLDARLTEVEAMVEAGRVLQADSLKIRLALEQAQQDLLALREGRVVAESALAQAVGHDGSVAVDGAPDWSEAALPGRDEAIAQALEHRSDLTAQTAARDALSRRHAAVNAEILPRVDARARWAWSDGSPYAESNWLEGIVTVTWSPFAAGTRSKRAAAIDAQVRAADAEIVEARRSIETEVSAALAAIETARAAVKVGNRAVEQASETARVERERHTAGRATTNDLLDAEASLRSQHTRLDLARLDLIRAWIQLGLATEGELASWTATR